MTCIPDFASGSETGTRLVFRARDSNRVPVALPPIKRHVCSGGREAGSSETSRQNAIDTPCRFHRPNDRSRSSIHFSMLPGHLISQMFS